MLRIPRRHLLRGGGALAATKLLTPAFAGFVLGKAGGGGSPYIAKAVHVSGFPNLSLPVADMVGIVNSPYGLMSFGYWTLQVKLTMFFTTLTVIFQ